MDIRTYGRALVCGDVEREPRGKRALGGHVSAKIKLIDTAYGPLPYEAELSFY